MTYPGFGETTLSPCSWSSSSTIQRQEKSSVCVCFLLGWCVPHLPTTTTFSWPYISWAEESRSLEEEMKERTRRRREKSITAVAAVIKWRHHRGRGKGPGVSWAGCWGEEEEKGGKIHRLPSPCCFEEQVRDTCFFKARVMMHYFFFLKHSRKMCIRRWNRRQSWRAFPLHPLFHSKAFSTFNNNALMTTRQRKRSLVIAEILPWFNQDIVLKNTLRLASLDHATRLDLIVHPGLKTPHVKLKYL